MPSRSLFSMRSSSCRPAPARRLLSFVLTALAATALAPLAQPAAAQAAVNGWPARSVSLVVPYGAGGGTDQIARVLAARLAETIGQPVVVENVAGAGGVVGTQRVMNAQPDGYTLLLGSGSELELTRITDPQANRSNWAPLSPVALVGTQPMILVARASLGIRDADALVAALKAKPGSLTWASAGIGTQLHVAGELVKSRAGIDMLHVPYKGAPQIVNDLVGGSVDLAMMVVPSVRPMLNEGKLVGLGVTDTRRSDAVPNVPAFEESRTIKGVDMKLWYGVFAPPGMPAALTGAIDAAIGKAMADPALRSRLTELAVTVADDSSAGALDRLKTSQLERIRTVFESLPQPAKP